MCIACHKDLPDGDAALKLITTAGSLLDMVPHSDKEYAKLLNADINWAARTRLLTPLGILVGAVLLLIIYRQRKQLKK